MVAGPDVPRSMRADEAPEVDALLRDAFSGPEEADLVAALRRDGAMASEMVLPWAGRIAAYAALSRMAGPEGWLCLAPVAVLPAWQDGAAAPPGRGRAQYRFGTRLVSMIAQAANAGAYGASVAVVVLGKPSFYARCGFSSARAARLISPYPVSHTLLAGPGDDAPGVGLAYPAAFAAPG